MTRLDVVHPFERQRLFARTWPFLMVMVLAWVLLPLFGRIEDGRYILAAAILNAGLVAMVLVTPWLRALDALTIVPPLLWLCVVVLLRHDTYGPAAGYSPLVMLTVLWVALYGTRWMLAVACIGVLVAIGLPPLVTDGGLYPDTDLRRAILYAVIGGFIGVAIQTTVAGLREERRRSAQLMTELTRRRAFELNDDVVQDLAVAKLSLEAGRPEDTHAALDRALTAGKRIISEMVDATGRFERDVASGDTNERS